MKYFDDRRIVATLDAGGTNFVFGAMRGCSFITDTVSYPSGSHDLGLCLSTIVKGFREIFSSLDQPPAAISFAFPGPADYPHGVIGGNLPNFPSFRDGVALGPYLEKEFGIPVFINNDGNLFAYGEAMAGALPWLNRELEKAGSDKRYRNLTGVTLGTGFGCGVVINGSLLLGDNGEGGNVWCLRNRKYPDCIADDSVSVRAVIREYAEFSGDGRDLSPKQIFDIAEGKLEGDREAAVRSFSELGAAAGDALATATSIADGIIVIGGGLTGAAKYIMPALIGAMNEETGMLDGTRFKRLQSETIYIDGKEALKKFTSSVSGTIKIFGHGCHVAYEREKRTAVLLSMEGASKSISTGAYIFALNSLDTEI